MIAGLFRYYLNVAVYQTWERSANNFNVHKHYELHSGQTDDRQLTDGRQCNETAWNILANILIVAFLINVVDRQRSVWLWDGSKIMFLKFSTV